MKRLLLRRAGLLLLWEFVFRMSLFGIIGNAELADMSETYRKELVSKKTRIVIYVLGVLDFVLSVGSLSRITEAEMSLPSFLMSYVM